MKDIHVDSRLQQVLTAKQAWEFRALPFVEEDGVIHIYVDRDTPRADASEELELATGKRVKLFPVDGTEIDRALSRFYRSSKGSVAAYHATADKDVLQDMLREARLMRASDIHFECFEGSARIRFRIDGHLMERYSVSVGEYPSLINRIKITANLDIAEKRLPQDGRIMVNNDGAAFDIRVSIVPTLHGEKAVLRLLGRDASEIDITSLGFSPAQLKEYLEAARRPNGIILISGPTGSGKTTTLYATLKVLNNETRNILTIEDPIEYTLAGINQVQLNERIGLDFNRALRTFLRQDPDVIMLGEIRDPETAQMAVRAALTGHLVLSTVHTNSAWGTVSRLLDMGVPAYLLAGTMNMSVAQRLVRKLCPHCRSSRPLSPSDLPSGVIIGTDAQTHQVAVGCDHCHFTGYKGRKALYEVITLDKELSETVRNGRMDVSDLLRQRAVVSIPEQAMAMVLAGDTTIDEVYSLLLDS